MKGLAYWTISLFCCLLAILIKGHHGFFIKHSGTGLCIKPKDSSFDSGSHGQQYYVEFYDNCLHSDAQFRYVDEEFVVNIGKDGTLIARIKKRYENRFLVYHPQNQVVRDFLREADHTLKQTASGSLITYQGTRCAIPKTLTTPGEGDELIRTANCNTELQKFTFGSVTSHGATMVDVNCATTQKMEVVMAEYGAFSNGKTFNSSTDAACSLPAACIVKNQCNDKSSCGITVDSNLFPFNQCAGTKRLHMEYQCVDNLATPITSVSDVRLSTDQNKGFVEVFNGTTWKKLSDESWDKTKQAALCRHLGYSDGENDTVVKNIVSGEMILSGDLYCQHRNQSCCAYLYPSASTAVSNMAYAKCKICDDPLLQNSTRFPDGIFSANDGNGYEVRQSNNGWCSTTSVSSYLQIDLKRDFYISYIATFADKARTKWLESYELKYSSTASDLDSKTAIMIAANPDAYRASITGLDILYARYLKIIPKSGNDFCLRVELCGQVLLPDPVSNVVVSKPTKTALVSWSVPQIEGYAPVTYFLVSLNGHGQKHNISRNGDSSQYTFNNLNLYTSYTVTIEAGNAYGVGESVPKTFATDDPGFFIKHSGTGLCIKPTNNYFDSGGWGQQYYVEFYDNCLHPDAQFRYVDEEFVVNIAKDGTLIARDGTRFKNRFLVYHPGRQATKDFLRQPDHTLKQTASGSLVTYQGNWCAIPKTLTTPVKEDQLIRTTTCGTELQKFTFGSVTSHGATMVDVSCATTQKMVVVMAEFGAFKQEAFKSRTDADCSLPVACKVLKGLCDGKTSCGITVNSSFFTFNQCTGSKRLHMEYRCVDNLSTAIKSVSKVRLSQQPHQGFVEVFDGTTWRKVNDENWDKRKQNALCHHLGLFNESRVAGTGDIGAGENLASGALYCQGIQPSNRSCCAFLYPSTSTSNAGSRIPYVKCKICNEPLLQNSTRFPKIVFSASVGDGNADDARWTNNGWCSTSAGSPWLQIDLQKDYYISHIATFGDKDQTKWVTSYVLQYSRTMNGLGSNGKEKAIKANDDAYRASIIKVDIVYARYLKLTKIKENDFCIRVELCGHVLLPDPVQNVVVDTITARSANVSWSVPQNEGHGGVTYFLIFLNGTKKGNVTRKDNNNQYTLNNLKPYSNYEVTIEAGNVYGVSENISGTFQTNQAAPEGPPLNVVVVSQSTSSLRVTWSPPHKNVSNGIITRYKICHSTVGVGESCDSDNSPTSHDINNLQAATKYILRISAGTKIGYGTWTPNITKITNQEPVKPTMKTYFSLEITLEKPRPNIQSLLIIVQAASSSSKITDHYQSNELQPYQNSSVPYVTAGLSVSGLPKNFTIGDNKTYNFANVNYVNHRLKQDTEYIVFLRFIGTGKIYYSTEWSPKVKTFKRPEAPLKLKAFTLSSSSLNISWEHPKLQENVQFLAYNVCYEGLCNSTERTTYLINDLKPGNKYEVRVCSVTTAGNSENNTISKFTNDAPLVTKNILNHNFEIELASKRETFNYVQVIVQAANRPQRAPDQYLSKDLKSYHDRVSNSDPYITAQLQSSQVPSSKIFTVGDAKWYNSTNASYYNKPLEQEEFYIVFARYLKNETKYYSSYWTEAIKTILIPAPQITNIDSYGKNSLNISWKQSGLPSGQTAINYIITYWKSENVQNALTVVTKSSSLFHILNDLEYKTKYFIQVQTRTEDGKSARSTEVSKTTNAEPLSKPKKEGKSYTVTLRKPREGGKVDVVKLIVLQLQSGSTIPTPPEKIKLVEFSKVKKNDNNMAFVVTELSMDAFTDAKHDVILQVSDAKRRRKRSSSVVKGLLTGVTYRTSQVNYNESGAAISRTSWSPGFSFTEDDRVTPAKTSGGTGLTGAVVGIVVAVLLILLAVVGFVFWRRRSNNRYSDKKAVYDNGNEEIGGLENGVDHNDGEGEASMGDMSDEGIYSNETGFTLKRKHPPVPISAFAHYVNEMKANEDLAFTTEYEDLPTTSNASWEVAKRPYNKKKNRYGNIVTYDHSRVNLSGDEDNDYINASFIDGVETNSYIACQGPTKYSLDDMWRMVWEQRTYSIVMVTSLIELGKPKCDKYWPDQGSERYGDIEVTLVKTEEFACHETRTFQIKKDDEEREVKHYYFSSWPDHGVPKYPTQLLAFRRHFRTHHLKQSGPIIVHCSAGVGRTGVFLAIDSTLEKIEKGLIESIDIFGQVSEMRTRRMNMIQTMEQYKFVHEAILETILCGMNEVDSSNIKKEIKKQSAVQAGGMTGFQEKFKRLGEVSPIFTEEECTAGLLEGNQSKNRSKNIYPAESSRVNISYIDSEENSDYINAVFVHGYLGRNYFIATQTPLPNTVNDFWRMVHEQKSSAIVLLNNVKDGTSFPKFWPSTRAQPKQYGDLTIQLESAVEKDGITTRKFMLSAYPDLQDAQVVKIFHYTKWHDHCIPETADVVITLTSLVEKSRHSSEEGPVIVVCSDGAGRSGTYIAISNLIERMKIEQAVDVFQSIKIIRASRPQFVENADQYQFCYSAVSSYLDAFSEYSNFE